MRVSFATQAAADTTMVGDVALTRLNMTGHSATVPGAIPAEDMPAVPSRLTVARAAEKAPMA